MKRIIAAVIVLLLIMCVTAASVGTAGSSADPLVSLSYIDDTFLLELIAGNAETVAARVAETYESALARLDEIYKSYIGYDFAPVFTELELKTGQSVTIITGASYTLLSGTASVEISAGSVVNVSTGFEVSSGSLLTANQRYFCAEDTVAVITAVADSLGFVDGYYNTNGKLNPNKTVFRDLRKTDWFFPAVDYVYENGLFAGTAEDTFSPALPMTRAMFVTVLYRHAGKPDVLAGSSFYDVLDPAEYYCTPVAWANENGIVAGYEDGSFLPGLSISREQMALIIYRYADFLGYNMTIAAGSTYESFPDRDDVASYADEAMRWSVANGIINGSDGMLLPADTATRAQVAQIIYNLCQKLLQMPPSPDVIQPANVETTPESASPDESISPDDAGPSASDNTGEPAPDETDALL